MFESIHQSINIHPGLDNNTDITRIVYKLFMLINLMIIIDITCYHRSHEIICYYCYH